MREKADTATVRAHVDGLYGGDWRRYERDLALARSISVKFSPARHATVGTSRYPGLGGRRR